MLLMLTSLTASNPPFISQAQRLKAFASEEGAERGDLKSENLTRESNESSHLAMQ